MNHQLSVGAKVYFAKEKRPYTVKALGQQFAICTKPFNAQRTCLYTIIDFYLDIRGPNNMIFNPYDYTVQADIDECLVDLINGENGLEVSRRRSIPLDIIRVDPPKIIWFSAAEERAMASQAVEEWGQQFESLMQTDESC